MTQTIGQKLKQAREEKHLTLEKASDATRIRTPYLQALEADDLSAMPSPVQARGFLRNYAEYLGLNVDQLLDEMRAEKNPSDEIIGPADISAESATPTPEPLPILELAPLSKPESDSIIQTESQPDTTLPKPKTSHRKKTDSQPDIDSPTTPKRRGRKKIEPEIEPAPVEEKQPEIVEEPVPQVQAEPELAVHEEFEPQREEIHQPDVNENLWQTWLNRIGSLLPARAKTPKPESLNPDSLLSDMQEQASVLENPTAESAEIFKEIGAELRKRRELLSLHLDEVERNTHVKGHYLEALEKGAMDNLPSTVQTRGMLSNYATFLDLDVDALLLRYADALQARHREKNPQLPTRKPGEPIISNVPSIRNFIAGDMIFGIGIAILLIGFSIWGVNRVMMIQSQQEIQPTARSISDVLLASPDPSLITKTPTLSPVESISTEVTVTIVIPTQNVNVKVQVNLVAVERTYMRVIVDGKTVFNGRVVPGAAYPFEAENQVEVLVGSGAAIRMAYNGRDLGLMGGLGQVVSNIYTAQEIITPTTLPTATITKTAIPTATIRPTLTPVPSKTLVPSKTPSP